MPQVHRNEISADEAQSLMSQSVPSKAGRGGRTKPQRVFAEQGVAMLSSVLQAPIAAKVNVKILRTFVRRRRLMATTGCP